MEMMMHTAENQSERQFVFLTPQSMRLEFLWTLLLIFGGSKRE